MRELTREERLFLWLNGVIGPDAPLFGQVFARYPDMEELFLLAKRRTLTAFTQWGPTFANRLCESAHEEFIEERLRFLVKNDVDFIPIISERYPELLKEIHHPPMALYVKGRLEASYPLTIGIVGMRRCTSYGEAVARHFGFELAENGVTVVSGLAAGIDSFAALGALGCVDAKTPTIAVLGSGIDVIYPSSNARLYDEIAERGAVISEFLPGTKPFRGNFPVRNRVISGLSRGVVIVEAAGRSGTTITANHALDQNRDVFAVPGRITDESSVGPNGMIQRGEAKPVFCIQDILFEYGMAAKSHKPTEVPDLTGLTELQIRIVEQLRTGEKNADELCESLSMSAADVNSALTILGFLGIIKQLPGRVFGL